MEEKLIELMPEFNLIEDKGLRENTIKVYKKALAAGGWSPEEMDEIPYTLLLEKSHASFLKKTRGFVKAALGLAEAIEGTYGDSVPINRDTIVASALLADVGKMVEYERDGNGKVVKSRHGKMLRHPFSGVGLCYEEGIPDEVMHCIATHAKEGEGTRATAEAIIIHHADFALFDVLKV